MGDFSRSRGGAARVLGSRDPLLPKLDAFDTLHASLVGSARYTLLDVDRNPPRARAANGKSRAASRASLTPREARAPSLSRIPSEDPTDATDRASPHPFRAPSAGMEKRGNPSVGPPIVRPLPRAPLVAVSRQRGWGRTSDGCHRSEPCSALPADRIGVQSDASPRWTGPERPTPPNPRCIPRPSTTRHPLLTAPP